MFRGQAISYTLVVLLVGHVYSAPANSGNQSPSSALSAPIPSYTGPKISTAPNEVLFNAASPNPEAVRGKLGANILGPQNLAIELQNSDALAPPTTDHGSMCVFIVNGCSLAQIFLQSEP
jgi:hypothetical protein